MFSGQRVRNDDRTSSTECREMPCDKGVLLLVKTFSMARRMSSDTSLKLVMMSVLEPVTSAVSILSIRKRTSVHIKAMGLFTIIKNMMVNKAIIKGVNKLG